MKKNYQQAITDSLRSMLKEKSFDDISVTDICLKTGVSRQCFYYYFKDINDCLLTMFLGCVDEIRSERRSDVKPRDLKDMLLEVYNYIYHNQDIIKNISPGPQRIYLYERLYSTIFANVKWRLPIWVPDSVILPEADIDYMVGFYASSFISSIQMWMGKNFRTTPEFEVVHFMIITDGIFKDWVQRFINFNRQKGLPLHANR